MLLDWESNQYIPPKACLFPNQPINLPITWDIFPTMSYKIDDLDRKILNRLQSDCSISIDMLAEQVHLSRNACWRRVKSMESRGLIIKRVALLDPHQLSLDLQVLVLIKTSEHNPSWLKKFKQIIANTPEIMGAQRMSGDLDYVLKVRVASVKDYDRFYQELIKQIPIADISASFVMEDIKDTTALPI